MTALRPCPLAAIALVLAACGGSDSSGSSSQTLQSVKAPAMPFSIAPTTLTGTVNGIAVTVDFSEIANTGTGTFGGQSAETASLTLTVLEGTTTLLTSMATSYYMTNPYMLLGESVTASGVTELAKITSVDTLPATLTVGASGPIFSATYYDATGETVIGSLTETYSVTANDANSLTLTLFGSGSVNGVASSQTEVYILSASGTITLTEVDVLVNGQTVKFTAS